MADTGARDRRVALALGAWAVLVFALLWAGFLTGLVAGGEAFTEAWARLNGLDPVVRIATWILFLPIAVGLWAWNAALPALVLAAVGAALVAWTLVAVGSLARTLRRA